jgi:hypothetical protein
MSASYLPPLTDELSKAHQSMPKFRATGMVLSLFYIDDPRHRDDYEARWREWAKSTPRRLWPDWLERWADQKSHVPRAGR